MRKMSCQESPRGEEWETGATGGRKAPKPRGSKHRLESDWPAERERRQRAGPGCEAVMAPDKAPRGPPCGGANLASHCSAVLS